ncbi:MAG TPA: pyridoxamine 5-phosphate oxidase, partial [Arthrobacter bacterium]|nr:pyridoxamine 5-phosphate oxidase [Arthrobacter sp.]
MNSYAVFLRGINVGGINIKMADLKDALASSGFAGVRTLLA